MDPIAIQLQDVSLQYPSGTLALDSFHLAVPRGAFVSLLGPSGCGKSTVLRLAAGLDRPTRGKVELSGETQPSTAFVFQDANLLPWRSIEANVGLPLELRGVSARERKDSVRESLAQVGLSGFENSYPRELSGGMRMRASLARALVTRPQVMLLDEPFGALDEITRQKLQEDLIELQLAQKWTVVFVTHSVFEAVYLADRVVVMTPRPGRVAGEQLIPFPRPRPANLRADAEFARTIGTLSLMLREAAI